MNEAAELIQFIQENQDDFYRFCYSYIKDSHITMDIVQDAVVKAIENYHRLRKKEYLKTWFYRIMINECKLYLRNKKVFEHICIEDVVKVEPDIQIILDVQQSMEGLPIKYKDIIYLKYYEDITFEEIAEVLHMKISTVKSRLYKALKIMKVDLEDHEGRDNHERRIKKAI